MARPDGVTYEAVAQAAVALRAEGVQPTVRLLQQRVGGSNTTVLKHFTAWKQANPAARPQQRDIPIEIVAAVESALARTEAAARSEIQAQLVDLQATLDAISEENEGILKTNAALLDLNAEVTSERDRLQGQLAEKASELQDLRDALGREQAAAEKARVDLAQARLLVDGAASRVAESQEREREARQALQRGQAEADAAREAKSAAEQRAAVAEAQLQAERAAHLASEARLDTLHREIQALSAGAAKAVAAEATATELRKTVTMLQALLAQSPGRPASAEPSAAALPSHERKDAGGTTKRR